MIYADVSTQNNGRASESDPNGWVELHETNQILKEKGLFLHISERDGYQHLYLERADGRFTVPVTSGHGK